MQNPNGVKDLLNSTIASMSQVFPISIDTKPPSMLQNAVIQGEIGVLIGIVGDVEGRLVIEGDIETFGKLGQSMFGMPLEGEMLHSFVGEMANMIAGNTSAIIYQKGHKIDITPPTVMVGQMQLYGFEKGISIAVSLAEVGTIHMILLLQKTEAA
ncbi:chemotaxis protein CheX [Paenibacillus sp. UNC499MF]|uniref:chemotaxis protein CheX n=1 Tax=Paenibacillus sp. UNC499MF TaxID=1502751 RepID=UPI0008A00BCE|nr:chemotaxis protein CheX [Paenibacillus sp. UNC499MF]SEG64539.1 chemotaxis protein CheX [Paenibacillus sp. UNC499MF]